MPRWLTRWLECRTRGCHIRRPCPDHPRRPESDAAAWDRQW